MKGYLFDTNFLDKISYNTNNNLYGSPLMIRIIYIWKFMNDNIFEQIICLCPVFVQMISYNLRFQENKR